MITLTEIETKQLAVLEPKLEALQKVIDKMADGSAMTSNQFYTAIKSKMDFTYFRIALTAALKSGKLTGIVSAKRAGYRKGEAVESSPVDSKPVTLTPQQKALAFVLPFLPTFQAVIDEQVTEGNFVTFGQLLEVVCKTHPELAGEAARVRLGFSEALKTQQIVGIYGVPAKGYTRGDGKGTKAANGSEPVVGESPKEDLTGMVVKLTTKDRLVATDKLNWTLQRRNGETWVNKGYFSSLEAAFEGVSRKLFNETMKREIGEAVALTDLSAKIREAEERIVAQIRAVAQVAAPVEPVQLEPVEAVEVEQDEDEVDAEAETQTPQAIEMLAASSAE